MSEQAPNIAGLEGLRTQYAEIAKSKASQVLIICSPFPHAIASAALLCRTYLSAGKLFHVKYIDPIVEVSALSRLIGNNPKVLPVIVGIKLLGAKTKKQEHWVSVGSQFLGKASPAAFPGSSSVAEAAYALASETVRPGIAELQLAAIGTLLQDFSPRRTSPLVEVAKECGILSPRTGFKLPGTNYLSITQVLLQSIYPYISGLSGDSKQVLKVLEDADIPYSKRTDPLSKLANNEAQRLNTVLIPRLHPRTISYALGSDLEVPREGKESPLRLVSGIAPLARAVWSRGELGKLLGVLIGDRARLLRSLIDTYLDYAKTTISGVGTATMQLNDTDTKIVTTDSWISAPVTDVPGEVLAEVGRILLETVFDDDDRLLLLRGSDCHAITWSTDATTLDRVLIGLHEAGILGVPTSPQAVRVNDPSSATTVKLEKMLASIGEAVPES
jgi:hypothetical protein